MRKTTGGPFAPPPPSGARVNNICALQLPNTGEFIGQKAKNTTTPPTRLMLAEILSTCFHIAGYIIKKSFNHFTAHVFFPILGAYYPQPIIYE